MQGTNVATYQLCHMSQKGLLELAQNSIWCASDIKTKHFSFYNMFDWTNIQCEDFMLFFPWYYRNYIFSKLGNLITKFGKYFCVLKPIKIILGAYNIPYSSCFSWVGLCLLTKQALGFRTERNLGTPRTIPLFRDATLENLSWGENHTTEFDGESW